MLIKVARRRRARKGIDPSMAVWPIQGSRARRRVLENPVCLHKRGKGIAIGTRTGTKWQAKTEDIETAKE